MYNTDISFLYRVQGPFRGLSWPASSIDTDTDHSQPVPDDVKFDSRQDQAAMEATIADFLKSLEVQEKRG